ncbi:SARP family transcriptional regulator [Nocardia neocaledoniensis NBRC 108232]|uniref:BTAD domain-containing putative transcriptional regulator n=1 Tax=Nocardia neocaledoniensis TaxID=236511 RepID=UPI001195E904|nr:BTAD domain-containing putative transcriptional regulator [Nocardia neocaledoniensis]GEM30976.1 SARP family transcriptional regulator [Nocardia neocaledoniensis NBRC 108232]
MRFGVLGPLTVWAADGTVVPVPEKKVRTLLAILLLDPGRVVSADRLIDGIWGTQVPAHPDGALQTLVSRLRRALGAVGSDMVVHRATGYLLDIAVDAVDSGSFLTAVEAARRADDPRQRVAGFADALAQWRGEAFADIADEPLALPTVTRLNDQHLLVQEEMAETRLLLGEYGALAAALPGLVEQHPLRERLRATQMRALHGAGRVAEALAVFRDVRHRLDTELGLEPGPALAELHEQILRADPAALPAARTPAEAAPRTNLPAPTTDLIGRRSDLAHVRALLSTERLVTLTGPGGVGKTRLALAAAAETSRGNTHGIWLVELGGHTVANEEVDGLADIVAAALGLRDDAPTPYRPAASSRDRMVRALRDRELLIVLDNCEHVIGAVAALVRLLLDRAPSVRVLATSREPLGIAGESLWQVPPLAVPAADAPLEAVLRSDAVRLFAERAAATAPGFVLDAGNAAAVATVCRRMDGLPLALELASTRVRVLGPARLAERLDDRFGLLTGGRRDAPARQQTLRAMIDWSWELLTAAEQAVLRRLAIHADGCTLDAAEQLCAGAGVSSGEVLDLLARLVDRSLVAVTHDGEPRYRLLESVGAYGIEQLRRYPAAQPYQTEYERLRYAHAAHYTDFAEQAAAHLRGPRQRHWLDRLDAESANLRRALDTAIDSGDATLAQRLALALTWYWFLRGRLGEARRSITRALAVPEPTAAPDSPRARLAVWRAAMGLLAGEGAGTAVEAGTAVRLFDELAPDERAGPGWFLGYAVTMFGVMDDAVQIIDRVLHEIPAGDDNWTTAAARTVRAIQRCSRGELDAARADAEHALTLFGDEYWGRLQATAVLGRLHEIRGEYGEAEARYRAGVKIAEELRLWAEAAEHWSQLGRIALLRQDFDCADELHERARRLAATHSDRPALETAEVGLAMSARRRGDLDTAEELLRPWLDWNLGFDAANGAALILAELGFIAELRGDAGAALALHERGRAAAERTGDPRAIALALEGLAGAHAAAGSPELSARLLDTATRMRASVGAALPPGERGDVDRIAGRLRSMPDGPVRDGGGTY